MSKRSALVGPLVVAAFGPKSAPGALLWSVSPLGAPQAMPKTKGTIHAETKCRKRCTAKSTPNKALENCMDQATRINLTQEVVTILMRNPKIANKVVEYAREQERFALTALQNDEFPSTYYRLRQLSPTYFMSVMMKIAQWDENTWFKLKSSPKLGDKDAMSTLFYFATATGPNDKMCKNRPVFQHLMEERHRQFGSRLDKLVFNTYGFVEWTKCGYYSLVVDNSGDVQNIKHVSGAMAARSRKANRPQQPKPKVNEIHWRTIVSWFV